LRKSRKSRYLLSASGREGDFLSSLVYGLGRTSERGLEEALGRRGRFLGTRT
jgi:hypothetical protein